MQNLDALAAAPTDKFFDALSEKDRFIVGIISKVEARRVLEE
jgi:hypothetical protein